MKNSKWILSVFVVGLAVFLLGARSADKIGKVTVVNGGVYEIENKDKKVKVGKPVFLGDEYKTTAGSVLEITYLNGSVIRLNENGQLKLEGSLTEAKPVVVKGELWSNVKKLNQAKATFDVKTQVATAAVRGTQFNVTVASNDSSMEVKLFSGKVELMPSSLVRKEIAGPQEVTLEQWVAIEPGQLVKMNWDGTFIKEKIPTELSDWVKKNLALDSLTGIQH